MNSVSACEIRLKYVLYAAPEKVFAALTDSKLISKWCDGSGMVSDKVNGAFEMFDGWAKGIVKTYLPSKKLSYTWKTSDWSKKAAPSLVTFIFTTHKVGTELILEHTGFPSEEEAEKHSSGWVDHVFEPLNDFLLSEFSV